MFTLDDVINATLDRANVIGEEHDTGKINAQAALFDERELAKLYSAAQLKAMREDPRRQREAVEAANKRAALDSTGGRVRAFFAGKPAWHGLGVTVDRVCSSAQAIALAGLDWRVEKVPMSFEYNERTVKTSDTFAVVRADTGTHLGTVGCRYAPIQNSDGFGYLDGVLSSVGAKYESAGSLYGGSKVWMLAHLPEHRFSIAGEDACEPYVVFMNTHDGSGAAACYPTSVRVECNNTLRISAKDRAKGISIRHTGSVKDKVKAAQKALGLAIDGFQSFKDNAEQMARMSCEPLEYFDGILDTVLDITRAEMQRGADALAASIAVTVAEREAARKLAEHKIKTRRDIFDDMVNRYESERCANGRGTLWGAFNAVTESADHGLAGGRLRGDDKQSRRFESVIAGRADEIKQVAYVQAISRA
jgi:phage/plasmid-like protein (TIGR03299 family)